MEKYKVLVKGVVQYEEKYLVVRKWFDDRILDPYQWGFLDGEIEFGEEPDKAVLRIINEQTGLHSSLDHILYTWSFLTGDIFHIGITYLCRVSSNEVILSEELVDSNWIIREEFENYLDQKVLEDIEKSELR